MYRHFQRLIFALPGIVMLLAGLWLRAAEPTAPSEASPTPTPAANAAIIIQAQARALDAQTRNDFPALIDALNDETDAHLRLHDFDQAERMRKEVLTLAEDHFGRDSLEAADALLNLGWFYGNLARYEEAQHAFDRCQEIRQRRLGPETAPVAEALNAIGVLEENRSNLMLAEAFYQQAIAIQEKVLGKESPVTANTWNNVATLYWIMGDYAAAQKYFTQALAVREKVLGPNSAVVAKTLNNLALLDSSLGDYDGAEDYFQRALKIRTSRLGLESQQTATTLSQLGLLYVRKGDDARAEPLLQQAIAVQEKIAHGDGPDLARSLMQLAMLYDRRKEFARAEPLHLRGLEIRRRILGQNHPEYAASLLALARHDHLQGKLELALPLYQQALRINQAVLGPDHPETVAIAGSLAFLEIELRRPDDAASRAHEVSEAQENVINGVFTFAPERQRMDFERTINPCDLPAALADADLLAEMVLRTKGVVLDSLLEDEAESRAMRDPDVREMMEKRRLLLAQLAQAGSTGAELSPSPGTAEDRRKLEQQEQDLEANLARKGIGSGQTRRALSTDVSEVRDALPANAALVEFVAYNRYMGKLTFEPSYGAIVIAHDLPTQWMPLGPASTIDALVKLDQKYMRKRVHDPVLAEVLRGLYQSVCAPVLAAVPPETKQIIFSPDGQLHFLSFATLLDSNQRFLASVFDLSYVASGRDLLREPGLSPRSKRITVFADPDYSRSSPEATGRTRGKSSDALLPPLPGTVREAAFLQDEAKKRGLDVAIYRGAEASKVNLVKQDSPYVLHLATHGLYLSLADQPLVPLPIGDAGKSPDAQAMSRSVLALAGAAPTLRDWRKGIFPQSENDGLLTAQQAAGLDLDHTWLVALSACDTGAGEVETGEGVLGLRRGFAEAGARNLLITLWTADDAETASLMEAFYREALQTGDAAGSLARVQRTALEEIRHRLGLSEAVRKAGPFILSF